MSGTVTNFATISGGIGISLVAGGNVTNGQSGSTTGLVTGYACGVSGGTVTNFGTISATSAYGSGVQGGAVANLGTIKGFRGVYSNLSAPSITNGQSGSSAGLIAGYGQDGVSITGTGGTVTNFGTITGASFKHGGVSISGSAGTVANFGTIAGTSAPGYGMADGVFLLAGNGSLNNGQSGSSAGLISGAYGVYIGGTGSTLTNFGRITGTGYYPGNAFTRYAFGVYVKKDAVISNSGTIESTGTRVFSDGIYLKAGGTITNGAGGLVTGYGHGIYVHGTGGTVTNFATIQSTGTAVMNGSGIYLNQGGRVANGGPAATNALITGVVDGVFATNLPATVTNYGTIMSTGPQGTGVYLSHGNTVINGRSDSSAALIRGASYGICIPDVTATIANFGRVEATAASGIGIYLDSGGTITNGASGLTGGVIKGGGFGILLAGLTAGTIVNFATIAGQTGVFVKATDITDTTLTNAGTISGTAGTAVSFSAGNDRLIVRPGAVFAGKVDGGGGSNTIELAAGAAAGTLTGLGTSFVSFGSVVFDAATAWTVTTDNPASFTGTIFGFAPSDSLDLTNVTFDSHGSASLLSGNVLQVTENGITYTFQLDPNQDFAGYIFEPSRDSGSGTLVSEIVEPTGTGFTAPTPWIKHGGTFQAGEAQYADLNGDGKADMIMQGLDNTFWVSLSTGNAFTAPQPWIKHGGSFQAGEAQYADLNGDGKADLIMQGLDNTFWVSLSTGTGFTDPQPWIKHGGTFQAGEAQYADLNGDGKADLIMQGLDNTFWVSLSTGAGFTNPLPWIHHGGSFQAGEAQYADLNGDGKADMIMQGLDNTFWVSLSTGAAFTNPEPWIHHGGSFQAGEAQYADLNGDGKADMIMQGLDNTFWVSLSTGAAFTAPQPWIHHGGSFVAGEAQYADLNGDGKSDLIMQGLDDTFWASTSTGTGFTDPLPWIHHGGSFQAGEAQYADLNGDRKADLLMQGLDNTFWVSLSTGNPPPMQGGRTASAQSGTATQPAPSGTMLSGMPADPGMNGAADSNVTSVPSGDLMLTAQPAPETFDFGSWVFGNAEIAGFDPTQDAVLLSSGLVGASRA